MPRDSKRVKKRMPAAKIFSDAQPTKNRYRRILNLRNSMLNTQETQRPKPLRLFAYLNEAGSRYRARRLCFVH